MPDEEQREDTTQEEQFGAFTARIVLPSERDDRGLNESHLLRLARERAHDPTVFDEFPPYFFESVISNGRADAYFTYMLKPTLRAYAEDAKAGVPVLLGHNVMSAPLGYSLTGRYEANGDTPGQARAFQPPTQEGETGPRVVSAAYIQAVDGPDGQCAAMIRRLRAGTQREVSVGYGGKVRYICVIDGLNIWDRNCPHIPGLEYDDKGNIVDSGGTLSLFGVDASRLREYSLVYRGATPGAAVRKAEQEALAGRLEPKYARYLESALHLTRRLPDTQPIYPAGSPNPTTEVRSVPEDPQNAAGEQQALPPEAREVEGQEGELMLVSHVALPEADLVRMGFTGEATPGEVVSGVIELRGLVTRLQGRADEADAYRSILIGQACTEGVRALREGFNETRQRKMLDVLTIAEIEEQRREWQQLGDRNYGGGRATREIRAGEPEGDRSDPAPNGAAPSEDNVPIGRFRI